MGEKPTPRKPWTGAERWQVWLAGAGLIVTIVTSVAQFARWAGHARERSGLGAAHAASPVCWTATGLV